MCLGEALDEMNDIHGHLTLFGITLGPAQDQKGRGTY